LELLPLKNRSPFVQSRSAQFLSALLITLATLAVTSCHSQSYLDYKFPQYTFANRPIPPSRLSNRVMVGVNDSSLGALNIIDAKLDLRGNIQNTIKSFIISGYSSAMPGRIYNFPAQTRGYVYSSSDNSLNMINYSTEANGGSAGSLGGASSSLAIPPNFNHIYSANETAGQLAIIDNTTSRNFSLNLPNVYQVAVNEGDTVVLAMVRNSNNVYRLVKLNANQYLTSPVAIQAIGAIDCQPFNSPVYCVVPVTGSLPGSSVSTFDRPAQAYFSLDGASAYVLNCGPECGGTKASVTFLQQGSLTVDVIPTTLPPYPTSVIANVPTPGGATVGLSDGTTLYLAGQQFQPDGLLAGRLTLLNLASLTAGAPFSISDGNHSKLLFADDNTLWVGSQFCATGERAHQATLGNTTQAANYNCLTRFDLGAHTVQIVPNAVTGTSAVVPFPNSNNNQYYYGSLDGICWVQTLHKVYTAYGGQVHAFNTADGSEIDNFNFTVQGTALDVAYMDAVTNADN
jgi:hypothetical protein